MKRVMWEGTDHWDLLLLEELPYQGQLVLSDFCKNALSQFKK
jgi:methylglutaconyl-CoA hydratase